MQSGRTGLLVLCVVGCLAMPSFGSGTELYKQGAAVFKADPVQAYPFFVKAAEEGHVPAMIGAAHCLENGVGTDCDYAKAIEWYEKAVAHNILKACEGLARIYASASDPEFHDGDKAVKYAEALVRKSPRSADALSVLAAAHARNLNFEQAVRFAHKAVECEPRAKEGSLLREQEAGYMRGRPYPEAATEDWLVQAVEKNSLWAIDFLVKKSSDRFDPNFNPKEAMSLCERGIEAGDGRFYLALGRLHLLQGRVERAEKCYRAFSKYLTEGSRKQPAPAEVELLGYFWQNARSAVEKAKVLNAWRARYLVTGSSTDLTLQGDDRVTEIDEEYASLEELQQAYPRITKDRPQLWTRTEDTELRLLITKEWARPSVAGVEFLLMIAAGKGDPEAEEMFSSMEAQLKKSRELLQNPEGLDPVVWASVLRDEAVKYCNNDVFPINLELAIDYLEKAYSLDPSAKTSCMLAGLYLRDYLFRRDYGERFIEPAVTWLERAHRKGYAPATRRLIQLYACDRDSEICDGEIAIQYALDYLDRCPEGDYEAQFLLACAYAGNEQSSKSIKIMQKLLDSFPDPKVQPYKQCLRDLKKFKQKEPYTMAFTASPYKKDTMLFASWAKTLPEE